MPYTSIENAKAADFPTTMNGAALTLGQVNKLASIYDAIKAQGNAEEPMAVAIKQFQELYKKEGDKWVLKQKTTESRDTKDTFHSDWLDSMGGIEYFEEAAVEGEEPRKSILVTLIREGFSDNVHESRRGVKYQRYYPASALERAINIAEGLPIYIGNATDHTAVKTLRDKAGVLKNVFIGEANGRKAIQGYFKPYGHFDWLIDMARDDKKAYGPSIEAGGQVRCPATVDGRPAAIVESLDELRAGLLVDNPAAGGAIHDVYESKTNGGVRMEAVKLEDLTEAERKVVMDEAREIVEAENDVQAKDAKIKDLEESVKKKDEKIKEYEDAITESKSAELVEAAFPKTKIKDDKGVEGEVDVLTESTRNRLKEELKGETDEAKIKEAVDKAVAEVNEILEAKGIKAGAPVNMGGGTTDGERGGESLHLTEARKDVKTAFGVKEEEKNDDKGEK